MDIPVFRGKNLYVGKSRRFFRFFIYNEKVIRCCGDYVVFGIEMPYTQGKGRFAGNRHCSLEKRNYIGGRGKSLFGLRGICPGNRVYVSVYFSAEACFNT